MENPFLQRGTKQGHGRKAEKRIAKETGATLTKASGALEWDKGDMSRKDGSVPLLFEIKTTNRESFSLKHEWLKKITREAKVVAAQPALVVSFVNDSGDSKTSGEWVMIPKTLFDSLEELT